MRLIEEALQIYTQRTGAAIKMEMRPFAQNYFEPHINVPPRMVKFSAGAEWSINVLANPPANDSSPVTLQVRFNEPSSRPGAINIIVLNSKKKFEVTGWGVLPTPDTASIFGSFDVEHYEEPLGKIFQQLIEAQLLETP